VIKIIDRTALIQADPGLGCDQCKGKGCGSSKLSQLFCSSPRQFKVNNLIDAKLGDDVVVEVAEGTLLRGISLVYILPMILTLVGAVLGNTWDSGVASNDIDAVIGAMLGLFGGFFLAKKIVIRIGQAYFQPYLVGLHRREP
jgi:sigma-E factor negative regulatory protein RseC